MNIPGDRQDHDDDTVTRLIGGLSIDAVERDRVFTYDETNYYLNGQAYPIVGGGGDEINTFETNEKELMVAFDSSLLTRTHHDVTNYVDKYTPTPVLMKYDRARQLTQLAVNLLQNHLSIVLDDHTISLTPEPCLVVNKDFYSTIQEFKWELTQLQNRVNMSNLSITLQKVMEVLDIETIVRGVNDANVPKLVVPITNNTLSDFVSFINLFLVNYMTYDDVLINQHTTNNTFYLLASTLYLLFASDTIWHAAVMNSRHSIVVHTAICIFIDVFTQRCTKELYIKRRHPKAVELMNSMYGSFPGLRSVNDLESLNEYMRKGDYLGLENYGDMYPFCLTFNMPDKMRIKFVYSQMREAMNYKIKLTEEEFWDHLEKFAKQDDGASWMTNDVYREEKLISIIPLLDQIIAQQPE